MVLLRSAAPGDPRAGVSPGTLLFNGWKDGNGYSGTARVFSKHCPGAPLEYQVSGPVAPNQLGVTLYGTRPKTQQCQPTGQMTTDTLVFTYQPPVLRWRCIGCVKEKKWYRLPGSNGGPLDPQSSALTY